jgi:hypothetical protein
MLEFLPKGTLGLVAEEMSLRAALFLVALIIGTLVFSAKE